MSDLKSAFRQFLKHPALTAAAVLALGLGIGANSALFSLIHHVLLSKLPFPRPERIMIIQSTDLANGINGGSVSGPDYLDWRKSAESFTAICAAQMPVRLNLSGKGEPMVVKGALITPSFFPVFGAPIQLGRPFADADAEPGRDNVVILGHRFWQRQFGGDPTIVGQTLNLNGRPCTVVGVAGRLFSFAEEMIEAYRPLTNNQLEQGRGSYYLTSFGRLRDGVSREHAEKELANACQAIAREHSWKGGRSARVAPLREELVRVIRPAFLVLYAAVGLVLLIACANVANLLLARSEGRRREMAIRFSLGASRGRVMRQLLTESVFLGLAGGVTGLAFAQWIIQGLLFLSPKVGGRSIPFFEEMSLDGGVLLFTGVVAVMAGIAFGLAPAWHATRSDLAGMLKESGTTTTSGRQHRILAGFVVGQVALSVMLLSGAGLMTRNFVRLAQVNPGFNPHQVLTMEMELPDLRYPTEASRVSFFHEVLARVRALPGVASAAMINLLPMANSDSSWDFRIVGAPELAPGHHNLAEYRVTTAGYLTSMRLPLKQGRWLTERDQGEPPVVVINDALARRFFSNQNPLGRLIKIGRFTNGCEIVGVVGDEKLFGLGTTPPATLFMPYTQNCGSLMSLVVRTTVPPMTLARSVREAVWSIDANQPVSNVRLMEQAIDDSISIQRFAAVLLTLFAFTAVLLAAIGIYGVLAYAVSQRTHEMGVRMALGAGTGRIVRLVLVRGLKWVGFGMAIGLAGALAVSKVLQGLLHEMSARDPLTYLVVLAVLALVAASACYLPARRAARLEPMKALRWE